MNKLILTILATLTFASVSAQRISFEKTTVNTGQTKWKHPVTAVFKFSNKDAHTPLRIVSVDGGCGCVSATWTKGDIVRGSEGTLSITYDAKLLGRFDRYIEVYTNASKKPERVRIKGVVANGNLKTLEDIYPYEIDNVYLNTTSVEFPDVYEGDSAKATIEIMNNRTDVFVPRLMHLPPYITATMRPEMIGRGRKGVIELTLHSELLNQLGLNQTSIYLSRFNGDRVSSENEISLTAVKLNRIEETSATDQPAFAISTSDLNLGKMGRKSKLAGSVRITNKGRATLELSNIQAFNQAITVAVPKTTLAPGESVQMKITVQQKYLGLSKAQPRVLIITNDPKTPKMVLNVRFE